MPSNPDGLDVVQLLKRETAALGGDAADEAPYDSPIEPLEDGVEVAAIFIVESGDSRPSRAVAIWKDGNNMRFRDLNNTGSGKTLSELVGGAAAADPAWRRHFLLMGA
jgi:hypothetical protein